jgi:predicted Fe-S protein YdhL (DUF1289 family)
MITEVRSPCINICRLISSKEFGLICEGCLRTPDEIKNWVYKSNKDKLEILKRLRLRKHDSVKFI